MSGATVGWLIHVAQGTSGTTGVQDVQGWLGIVSQLGVVGVLVWAVQAMLKSNKLYLDETRRAEIARTDALVGSLNSSNAQHIASMTTLTQTQLAAITSMQALVKEQRELVHEVRSLATEIGVVRQMRGEDSKQE